MPLPVSLSDTAMKAPGSASWLSANVPGYPVWVGLAIDQAQLLSRWYGSLEAYGIAAASGSLALLIASWVAIRRTRAEQEASLLLHTETERRLHAEQRMRQVHRLEAVGQLAGGIAHDFNNLLTVIVGSLDVIGRSEGLSDRSRMFLSVARSASERGARLTASLLAFARQQLMQPEGLGVNQLISEFLARRDPVPHGASRSSVYRPQALRPAR
jgi:signal transduction histidine kinase